MKKLCGGLLITAAILVILAGYFRECDLLNSICSIWVKVLLSVTVIIGVYLMTFTKENK